MRNIKFLKLRVKRKQRRLELIKLGFYKYHKEINSKLTFKTLK